MSLYESITHKVHSLDIPVLVAGYVPAYFAFIDVNHILAGASAILSMSYTIWKWRKERNK